MFYVRAADAGLRRAIAADPGNSFMSPVHPLRSDSVFVACAGHHITSRANHRLSDGDKNHFSAKSFQCDPGRERSVWAVGGECFAVLVLVVESAPSRR